MRSEFEPVIFNTDPSFQEVEIYFAHDIHQGSKQADMAKWNRFKAEILKEPNRFLIMVGDYCENALISSKGDIYESTMPPASQKEWLADEVYHLRERIICMVPGNHENNRITRTCGLYPVYDVAMMAGIGDRYRHSFALVDIGVGDHSRKGTDRKGNMRQLHYFGYITHRLKDIKTCSGADFVEGIDFAAYGHDHDPKDHARARLVYDAYNKMVTQRSVEVIDAGSFLTYGGYAVAGGFRPLSEKTYKIKLFNGRKKNIQTIGFYV